MNRWQRHIMLIMTGLSLTGYTAGATDVPVVATPPATLSGPKLMQTGKAPSLTDQKKRICLHRPVRQKALSPKRRQAQPFPLLDLWIKIRDAQLS